MARDGSEVWIGQNVQLVVEGGRVSGFQAVCRDVTDRRRVEEALRESEEKYRELSIVDALTGLYNSRHFHEVMDREQNRANRYNQPLTLLMIDIDDFKAFNDAYGHVDGAGYWRDSDKSSKVRCGRPTLLFVTAARSLRSCCR
jgi:predicted signal transduction protein with EAL and GGDEF domain